MILLRGFIKGVDWLAENVGKKAAWIAVIILLEMTYEVIVRYAFNRPTLWSYDVTYMLGGSLYILLAPYVLLKNGHLRVDVAYARLSRRAKSILDSLLTPLLFFPPFTAITMYAWKYAFRSLEHGEVSQIGIWEPTMTPFRFVIALGFSLLMLEGIAWYIRNLFFATKGKDLITSKEIEDRSYD